jgi:hypothetical protein
LCSTEAELEAQKNVAVATSRGLGRGWSTCTDVYVQVQLVGQLDGTLTTLDGQQVQRPLAEMDLFEAWRHLREVMYIPGKGTWFTARLSVESNGRHHFDFDWDNKPRWPAHVDASGEVLEGEHPGTSDLRADLDRFPRSREFLPAWFGDLPSADAVTFHDEHLPADLSALAEHADWTPIFNGTKRMVADLVMDEELEYTDEAEIGDFLLNDLLGQISAQRLVSIMRSAQSERVVEGLPELDEGDSGESAHDYLVARPALTPVVTSLRQVLERVAAAVVESADTSGADSD